MSSRLQIAVCEALSLVRTSNVLEATALIRRALSGDKSDEAHDEVHTGLARFPSTTSRSLNAPMKSGSTTPAARSFAPKEARKPPSVKVPKEHNAISNFTSRIYRHVERDLGYMLYVPRSPSGHERSVLLMLHGCTQNPRDFALGTQMNKLAEEFNLIVAYPLQPKSANSSGCWNWFDARHQKHGCGEPAMLAALAEFLRSEFGVSENRVFAAGLSAGGAMAEILASTYPHQFAAVGVHSGLPYGAATSLSNAFGAMNGSSKREASSSAKSAKQSRRIIIHGSSDTTVHPSNADRIVDSARRRSSALTEVAYTEDIDGREVVRIILMDKNDSIVEQWIVAGGGHTWFGGNAKGSHTDSKGPDASRAMVKFFLSI